MHEVAGLQLRDAHVDVVLAHDGVTRDRERPFLGALARRRPHRDRGGRDGDEHRIHLTLTAHFRLRRRSGRRRLRAGLRARGRSRRRRVGRERDHASSDDLPFGAEADADEEARALPDDESRAACDDVALLHDRFAVESDDERPARLGLARANRHPVDANAKNRRCKHRPSARDGRRLRLAAVSAVVGQAERHCDAEHDDERTEYTCEPFHAACTSWWMFLGG